MNEQKYTCLGSCQAIISSKQFEKGLIACGNDICSHKGKPFVKGDKCIVCRQTSSQNNPHAH